MTDKRTTEEKKLQKLCEEILAKDRSVRFAGVANHLGHLVTSAYRPGLAPLMTKKETEHYALAAVTRALMRETFQSKLGKLRYAIGIYEKLIRATVNISSEEKPSFFLLLSFETGTEATDIIEDKVLPHISKWLPT